MKTKVLLFSLLISASIFGQATLPVSRTAWDVTPTGWTDSNLLTYLTIFACSGSNGARFDASTQNKIVNFNSAPDQLTFVVKSNATTTSSLLVQQSADGITYTNIVNLTNTVDLPTACTTKGPYTLLTTTRFVRWTFTKGSSNMTMDDVAITAGQTTLFSENFNTTNQFSLNTGAGFGDNQWVVNNVYAGGLFGLIVDTPNEPAGIVGAPNSTYMHITNTTTACGSFGVCNANFDTGSVSNQTADVTNNIVTTGYTGVSFSFWYLSAGQAGTSYGNVEYSINGGTSYTPIGAQLSGVTGWTKLTLTNAAFDNQSQLKFRFRWINGAAGSDPAFAVDDVLVQAPPIALSPEILIEGNLVEIVDGDVTPGLPDFTNFGTVSVAAGTIIRTFTIKNTGGTALNLTGIAPYVVIGGVNAADFALTGDPITPIPAFGSTSFQVTFNPSAVGIRSANITIANNDSNENPYNFDISGNGSACVPTLTVTSITPTSGPVATEVTINGTGFTTASNVVFGATTAIFTVVSATVIRATVPAGVVSGNLLITDSAGCELSFSTYTVINADNVSCDGASLFTDLIISEVYDSNSLNVWHMELYNPTPNPINLATANYTLKRYSTIGDLAPTRTIALTGVVAAGGVYYAQLGNTGVPCVGIYNFTELGNGINAQDEIRLAKNGVDVDIVQCPNEVGYSIRRNLTAAGPTMTFAAANWTFNLNEVCTDLGIPYLALVNPPITTLPTVAFACNNNTMQITVLGTQGIAGGQLLTYQWFSSAPGAIGWTTLTNTGIYFGVTTNVLSISDLSAINNVQYYCQVRENSATCFKASNATKVNVTGAYTEWNGTWTNGTPTLSKYVAIKANYNTSTNGNIDACTMRIFSGNLTIADNTYVNIQNDLTVDTGAILNIQNKGSLVQISETSFMTNSGTTTVNKTTTPYVQYDYTYWCSPIKGETIGSVFAANPAGRIYDFNTANYLDLHNSSSGGSIGFPQVLGISDTFDDSGDDWQPKTGTTSMLEAKGYIAMGPTAFGISGQSVVFSENGLNGRLNNGPVSIAVSKDKYNTDLLTGAATFHTNSNLIGNPYSSAIDLVELKADNPLLTGTFYFWTHKTPIAVVNPGPWLYNFTNNDYVTYTVGTGGSASSCAGCPIPDRYVDSCQGFFANVSGNGSVIFNNSQRVSSNNASFYRTSIQADSKIWLNFGASNGETRQILIGFVAGAQDAYNPYYDGLRMENGTGFDFYSYITSNPEQRLAVQGLDVFNDQKTVPLGLEIIESGNHSISIGNLEGVFNEGQAIYLQDNVTNTIHDFADGAYVFSNEISDILNDRFLLRFTNPALDIVATASEANDVFITSSNNKTTIKSNKFKINKVFIYDLLGRELLSKTALKDYNFSTDTSWSKQALVVKIVLENGVVVTKKIIN